MKIRKGKSAFFARCTEAKARKINPVQTSEKPEKKPLFLVMQRYYFNQIFDGTKKIEFRENKPFYSSRLTTGGKYRNFKTVILQEGYHAGARQMTLQIEKIELCTDFEIHLGKIINKNF